MRSRTHELTLDEAAPSDEKTSATALLGSPVGCWNDRALGSERKASCPFGHKTALLVRATDSNVTAVAVAAAAPGCSNIITVASIFIEARAPTSLLAPTPQRPMRPRCVAIQLLPYSSHTAVAIQL